MWLSFYSAEDDSCLSFRIIISKKSNAGAGTLQAGRGWAQCANVKRLGAVTMGRVKDSMKYQGANNEERAQAEEQRSCSRDEGAKQTRYGRECGSVSRLAVPHQTC